MFYFHVISCFKVQVTSNNAQSVPSFTDSVFMYANITLANINYIKNTPFFLFVSVAWKMFFSVFNVIELFLWCDRNAFVYEKPHAIQTIRGKTRESFKYANNNNKGTHGDNLSIRFNFPRNFT